MKILLIERFQMLLKKKSKVNRQTRQSIKLTPKFVYKKTKIKRHKLSKKQLPRKTKIGLRKIIIRLIIFLLVGLLILGIYLGINHLKVSRIECQTRFQACPQEIIDWLTHYQNRSLIRVWLVLEDELKDQFVNLTRVDREISGFDRLRLDLDIDPVIGSITTMRLQTQDQYYLVTENGLLTKLTNQPILPIVILDQLKTPNKHVLPRKQAKAVKIARAMSFQGYRFNATQFADNNLEIELFNGLSVVMPLDDDQSAEDLVSALQLILSQATIEVNRHQIDLRYNQPVIRDLTVTIIPTPTATASAELE